MIQLKPGIHPSALNKPRKADRRQRRSAKKAKGRLDFERVFSDPAVKPFDQVEWEHRTAEITDDSGTIIFKQENVEVPKNWSALATKIAVSKYFYGDIAHGTDPHKGGRESSVRQLIRAGKGFEQRTDVIGEFAVADSSLLQNMSRENVEIKLRRNMQVSGVTKNRFDQTRMIEN